MIEEDLIQLRLIEGVYNASHQYKIMEQLQIGNISLNTCIDFLQQTWIYRISTPVFSKWPWCREF